MTTEQEIETMIQLRGLTEPRLTPGWIDSRIAAVQYHVFDRLTICVMTLRNGHIITGESAAASGGNFNQLIGEKRAYDKARDKIWELEGYLLRQQLHERSTVQADSVVYIVADKGFPLAFMLVAGEYRFDLHPDLEPQNAFMAADFATRMAANFAITQFFISGVEAQAELADALGREIRAVNGGYEVVISEG